MPLQDPSSKPEMEKPFALCERLLFEKERISPWRNACSSGVGEKVLPLSSNNSILTGRDFFLSGNSQKLSGNSQKLSCTNQSLSSTSRNFAPAPVQECNIKSPFAIEGALSKPYKIASAISLSSLRMSTFLFKFSLNLPAFVQSSSSAFKSNVPPFSDEYMMIDLNGIE